MKKLLVFLGLVLVFVLALGVIVYQPDLPLEQLKGKYADSQSRFMDLQGMQVHYRDQGHGPVLVLLHGTGASLHTWDGWTAQLSGDFRVVRLDLPGFGLTGPNPKRDYSMDFYTGLLGEFLDRLDIQSCFLAGNSLGGRIAWEFTWRNPGRVKKLILVDPSGFPIPGEPPLAFKMARLPVLSGAMEHIGARFLVERSLREVYGDPDKVTDDLVQRYHELFLRPGNRQAFGDRARMAYGDNSTDNLAKIDIPVLIMWGTLDRWIPPDHAMKFKQALKHSRIVRYPGLGHVPMEEAPAITAADARAFLLEG